MGSIVKNLFIMLILFMVAAMTADAESEIIENDNSIDSENTYPVTTTDVPGINRSPAIVNGDVMLTDDMPENYLDNYPNDDLAHKVNPIDYSEDNSKETFPEDEEDSFEEDSYSGDFEATYSE